MAKITNNSRSSLDFITGTKDGVAVTESLKPGETREINVDLDSAQIRGQHLSGLISVAGATPPTRLPRGTAASDAERRSAPTLGGEAKIRE